MNNKSRTDLLSESILQQEVPIGRPGSQALYDHLKEAAETAAPINPVTAGHQDTTMMTQNKLGH